jgi:hypothetical protein
MATYLELIHTVEKILTKKGEMYCITETEYSKDFNMLLNDTIIDCFLDESDKNDAKTFHPEETVQRISQGVMQPKPKSVRKPRKKLKQ